MPIHQQCCFCEQPRRVIRGQVGRPAPLDRALQFDQRIDRQRVKRLLIGTAIEEAGVSTVAEILDQQKTARTVFSEDLGCAEPESAQQRRDGDVGGDILLRRGASIRTARRPLP